MRKPFLSRWFGIGAALLLLPVKEIFNPWYKQIGRIIGYNDPDILRVCKQARQAFTEIVYIPRSYR
jgi:hypothetical protein